MKFWFRYMQTKECSDSNYLWQKKTDKICKQRTFPETWKNLCVTKNQCNSIQNNVDVNL